MNNKVLEVFEKNRNLYRTKSFKKAKNNLSSALISKLLRFLLHILWQCVGSFKQGDSAEYLHLTFFLPRQTIRFHAVYSSKRNSGRWPLNKPKQGLEGSPYLSSSKRGCSDFTVSVLRFRRREHVPEPKRFIPCSCDNCLSIW